MRHQVSEEHAAKIGEWMQTRGGVLLWTSQDLSDPTWSSYTPALTADGKEYPKPHWKAGSIPLLISAPEDISVTTYKEVKRFQVGVRTGDNGLTLKVTDGGSRRIRKEVGKAGEGATYRFDYSTQEAVILAVDKEVSLVDWLRANPPPQHAKE